MPSTVNAPPKDDPLLIRREVAELARFHPKTVFNAVRRGGLAEVKIGRSVRYRTSDVMTWINGGRQPVPGEGAGHA